MAQLPIRQLTLYKQGIGYFNRRGSVDERTVSLIIPREGTNDALKSLNVMVHQGGQVLSVDYETPEDKNKLLTELPVKLGNKSSLIDLLTSLRGSRARDGVAAIRAAVRSNFPAIHQRAAGGDGGQR